MANEPLLPGFKFENIQGRNFHLNQQFNVVNGYNVPKLNLTNLTEAEREPFYDTKREFQPYTVQHDFINFDPLEKYKKWRKPEPKTFEPHFVMYDRKCLSFQGYYKYKISEQDVEKYWYRKINLIYYLEDDTMTVIEPPVINSGYPQGRLVRRGRIPKPSTVNTWQWKDLNVGADIKIYGIVFHLTSCDAFTREYLSRQGIEVNANEEIPANILSKEGSHRKLEHYYGLEEATPFRDKLYKFLQYDRKVLRFYALWDDAGNEVGDARHYKIYYYLIDDTVEVRQFKVRNVYQGQFSRLLSRTRLPKNRPSSDATVSALGAQHDYYEPKDFKVGEHVFVVGRKFFIYDCDEFTRRYYAECLKIQQPPAIGVKEKCPEPVVKPIPPHTGIGQPEDTLQSCLSIIPKPPRKDVIHYIENTNKALRYSAKLDSSIENDKDRNFIIQFSLADGKMSIYETRTPNSGFSCGYFLKSSLVTKPTSTEHKPDYYTPADFSIGSNVDIFGRKFTITGADLAVYRYMEKRPEKFSQEVVNSVKEYLQRSGILDSDANEIENITIMEDKPPF